jgi:hypothetical protein
MAQTLIVFVVLSLIGFSSIFASANGERGDGNKITSERIVSSFNEIEIIHEYDIRGSAGRGILRIHSDREYRVSVNIDSNLDQYIDVVNENSKLKIEIKRKLSKNFTVDIYCPNISGITIGSAGQVEFVDKMITPSLNINIDGAGKIKGAIECDSFFADIDGAGTIEINGSSNEAHVNIDGRGFFNGYEFKINNGVFNADGAGRAKCWVTDNLTASVTGVSRIQYHGTPRVDKARSGLGSVRKR